MNTQLVSGSKLALALAISAVLGACGGGGGDSSTPATPVATNGSGSTTTSTAGGTTTATNSTPAASTPATTAPSAPATAPTATTPATNSPVATAPAATAPAPASNTQAAALINRAMYQKMHRECPAPSGSSDPAVVACAAGVYVGKDASDGKDCTVKLTKEGEVTFTVGDKVRVYKITQYFQSGFVNPSEESAPYLLNVHMAGFSAEDAANKVHGFTLNLNSKGDGSTLPDDFEIRYTYGDVITSDELTICKFPL